MTCITIYSKKDNKIQKGSVNSYEKKDKNTVF